MQPGSGQTSDLSSVSWWGWRGAGTMGGQRAPNCCILPQPPIPCTVQCQRMPCNCSFIAMHCTVVSLWVPAVSGAAPNPLMPMGAHHHPGVQYAALDTPTNIMIPQKPSKFLKRLSLEEKLCSEGSLID